MTIREKVTEIVPKLRQLMSYEQVVLDDKYSEGTLDELKSNCLELAEEIIADLEAIKSIVEAWEH